MRLMYREFLAHWSQVLKRIMQHEFAEDYFNEPVDAVELDLPDYHDIVKVRHQDAPHL